MTFNRELMLLSDDELVIRLHETMEYHDGLVDSAPMGDERIYFAGKAIEAIKAEQERRGYKPCSSCFDFGDVWDMHGESYGFCKCNAGLRLKEFAERRKAPTDDVNDPYPGYFVSGIDDEGRDILSPCPSNAQQQGESQ
ncbi:hypothetical protein [Rhizobium phage RHph_X2_25]|nr:hypothetical protein [Rhizobium phage RHph_X2_25]